MFLLVIQQQLLFGKKSKKKLDIPVLGVILPGSSAAIKSTISGQIGIIGTPMTIKSNIYEQKILDLSPQMKVRSLACPKFVPIVESNKMNSSVAKKIVYESLSPLVGKIDTLVLGCTHYPLPHYSKCNGTRC